MPPLFEVNLLYSFSFFLTRTRIDVPEISRIRIQRPSGALSPVLGTSVFGSSSFGFSIGFSGVGSGFGSSSGSSDVGSSFGSSSGSSSGTFSSTVWPSSVISLCSAAFISFSGVPVVPQIEGCTFCQIKSN